AVSSHNTISGMRVHQFPFGISVQAGDFPTPGTAGTVEHNTVTNNIVADSSFLGIVMLTGDTSGSVLAHTTITQNLAQQNGLVGIAVLANSTAAGADTQITYTTITDNEAKENGALGVYVLSLG